MTSQTFDPPQGVGSAGVDSPYYHYDLYGNLIAETDPNGLMIRSYIRLNGQPLAMVTSDNSIYYYHNDHLGTPQKMTNTSGTVVWAADYLPFGQAEPKRG